MDDTLRIYTFGGLRFEQNGRALPSFATRKEEALVVYLAATRSVHPREVLADLLWDERTQTQALANLRVVLSGMRQHLAPYLTITRQMVGLNPEVPIWLDAVDLEDQLAGIAEQWTLSSAELSPELAERLDQAVSLYKGEFLSGFYLRDSQGFETWITQERERLHRQVIEALHHLVEIYLNCGAYSAGITQASRLLQLDPLREEAHRQMMLLLARTGQRNAAVTQFETCCRLLSEELAAEPDSETVTLCKDIQSGKIGAGPSAASKLATRESRAVSPLHNPYKGLQAFQENDAENFFGRDSFVVELLDRLKSPSDDAPFLALIGPSGSGKSSIIKAGLIPALRKESPPWSILELVPGAQPFQELAAALQPAADKSITPEALLNQLRQDENGLRDVAARLFGDIGEKAAYSLLIIDQFEEIFTLVEDEATRKRFLDSLCRAVTVPMRPDRPPLHVLISLRADFYDRPMRYPDFGQLVSRCHLPVLPLTPEQLEQAIVLPAERVGLTFESGLVATMIADVAEQSGILPLLQYALTELYVHRSDRSLTLRAYQDMGGVSGALGGRASELYAALDANGQRVARQLFLRLVAPTDGPDDMRQRVPRTELASIADNAQVMDTVINLYGKYRLLTFDFDPTTNSPTVEIAHEALIRGWKQLRDWLDEGRTMLRRHRRLMTATREWMSSGCNASFLATGERLQQFERLDANPVVSLNQDERAFLDASLQERAAEQAREAERRRHEETLFRRSRNFLKALYAVVIVATISLLLLMGIMLTQQRRAQYYEQAALESALTATSIEGQAVANFQRSESARLVREGDYILNKGNPAVETAVLLYIRALKISYLPEAETSLLRALSLISTQQIFKGHTSWIMSAVFLPDGKEAMTASRDNTARLWDIQTGKELRRFTGHTADINSITISPDGKYAVTASSDKTVRLWDIERGAELRQFAGHTDEVNSVAISPDGRYVLTGSSDMTIRLWDIQTGAELRQFKGHAKSVKTVSFSPDGKYILSGSRDMTARLWDVTSGAQVQTFIGHTNTIFAVAVSPDGKFALTGSSDGTARLWDITNGAQLHILSGHRGWVTAAAFTQTGDVLTASRDGTARLWSRESGLETYRFIGHTGGIEGLAVSADGSYILTGGMDNTARLWRTRTNSSQDTLVGHSGFVTSVVFSPDSKYALTGSADNTARLWEVRTRRQVQQFVGHTDQVLSVAFSPDGKYILTGSRDSTMRLWDVKTGQQLRLFSTHGGWTSSVAFSPDGKYALTVDGLDYSARLWKLDSGEQVREFIGHTRPIFVVAFSSDGKYLLTGSADNTARLWNTETGQTIQIYAQHTNFVISAVFSPDDKYVLTGSEDHSAILWETFSGKQIQSFPQQDAGAYRVAFSPDGKYIATVSGRNLARPSDVSRIIQLWDPVTGNKVRTVAAPDQEVYSIAFSPDGNYILTGQGYGEVHLWIADYRNLLTMACARVFGDLSPADRQAFNITDDKATCAR